MIRNVCIHVSNEQPLLVDLYDLPSASDAGLLCTNVRTMDGKRPVFVDSMAATFFFPYHIVRFLEIPEGALDRGAEPTGDARPREAAEPRLRGAEEPDSRLAVIVPAGSGNGEDVDLDVDLEIDEGFLQRIRDL